MMKNNCFQLATVAWILIFTMVGNSYAQEREIPKHWKEVKICGLSFLVPKELKDKKARGIDSCVASFRSKNLSLGMDFGAYTATPTDTHNYQSTTEILEIDGKKATITNQSYLYIVTNEWESGKIALGMSFSGKTATDLATARQIFQSIRFTNK